VKFIQVGASVLDLTLLKRCVLLPNLCAHGNGETSRRMIPVFGLNGKRTVPNCKAVHFADVEPFEGTIPSEYADRTVVSSSAGVIFLAERAVIEHRILALCAERSIALTIDLSNYDDL
jgi:hypothetical protein